MPGDDILRVRAPTNKSAISAYRVFTGSWAFRSFSLSERQTSSVDENDERNDKETSSRSGNLAQGDKGGARFYEASPRAVLSPLVNSLCEETNEGRVEKQNKGVLKLR
ncbi:hypothetical protein ALC56_07816 [Trachymyrmex septentrionalis]|uniref:Uncharacterized protein n=1 Tax=Trachymyrmex septentrionalis TaxID=34720 RepID=A0A195FBM8_9HYME|nr:hypothetical protein ALC56_07816 [Trachymyrmex septentrionalis]